MVLLEKLTERLATAMLAVAGLAVAFMMLVTCADVVLRYFRMPIAGTFELVYLAGGIAVSFAMAHTTLARGHVAVSIIVGRFTRRWQHSVDAVTSFLGLGLFTVASWRMFVMAGTYHRTNMVSPTLEIPLYPVVYAMSVALAAVCIVQFTTLVRHVGGVLGKWR